MRLVRTVRARWRLWVCLTFYVLLAGYLTWHAVT